MDYKGLSSEHPRVNGLTELENLGFLMDMPDSLRMAPAYGSFDMGIDGTLMGHGSTINPAKLHFAGSSQRFPLGHNAHDMHFTMNEEMSFDWMNEFDAAVALENDNNPSINESSPSAMSMGSQCMVSEVYGQRGHAGWPHPYPYLQWLAQPFSCARFDQPVCHRPLTDDVGRIGDPLESRPRKPCRPSH